MKCYMIQFTSGIDTGNHPPEVEAKLDAWLAAKRARDYSISDKLRALEHKFEPQYMIPHV